MQDDTTPSVERGQESDDAQSDLTTTRRAFAALAALAVGGSAPAAASSDDGATRVAREDIEIEATRPSDGGDVYLTLDGETFVFGSMLFPKHRLSDAERLAFGSAGEGYDPRTVDDWAEVER